MQHNYDDKTTYSNIKPFTTKLTCRKKIWKHSD